MKTWILSVLALGLALFTAPAMAQQDIFTCVMNVGHTVCAGEEPPNGVSTASENGHVIKATAGVLVGFQANNWLTANGLTVMVLDGSAVPSNGTLATCTGLASQTNPCIMKWYGIPAAPSASQPATFAVNYAPGPFLHYFNGLTFVCSSTGPTTLTLSANCTFSAEIQ